MSRSRPDVVLVVDDNDDIRELYAALFADEGYEVLQAANGQEALDRISETKPDVVVMDLSMPVMDGWEATKHIKADPATSDVFVIAVTAHATSLGLANARDFGADKVLAKPCLPDELLRNVRKLLDDE